ncbi:MAG: guanylate kinase [Betaproteobacteria bacterium RIFCSPHIGHO2_12_FULL_69_13]|nr:MAG: guanylate kinase [Betaproteobacteria bacterium RIFCSPHIGHO2_12_FULL_69_13]OGA66296.1 MAG: guanylate kinase [Betaproteobacteria bacterium RIFCSPLOWO2_12_FULL_68_20]
MQGLLFVVTAPSGAGKSSLIAGVLKGDPRLKLSVSHTTRAPRPGEANAREYHFVDEATFLAMLGRAEFLESAQVHGHRYGTSHRALAAAIAGGNDVVLEIDWQGAQQVRRLHPECVGVFILPPSLAELERRLRARGQDSDDVMRRRLENAREEMAHAPEFDYAIINKEFEAARQDLAAIVRAERLAMARQLERHPELFQPRV